MSTPPVRLDLSLTLHLSQRVDADVYFAGLDTPQTRERYRALDLVEWGFEEEYERPIAWLLAEADVEAAPLTLVGDREPLHADVTRSEIRVFGRYGKDGHWTLDDFYDLADRVDWIAQTWLDHLAANPNRGDGHRTERDRILATRLASRCDTPLFALDAAAAAPVR